MIISASDATWDIVIVTTLTLAWTLHISLLCIDDYKALDGARDFGTKGGKRRDEGRSKEDEGGNRKEEEEGERPRTGIRVREMEGGGARMRGMSEEGQTRGG